NLNKEINAGLADPNMKARLVDLGGTVLAGSPADFGKLIAEETEKWGKVIRAANIKAEEIRAPHSITFRSANRRPLDEGNQISSNLLRCICRLLMLWTAPPPARECHDVGAARAPTIRRSYACKRLRRSVSTLPSRCFRCTALMLPARCLSAVS